MSKTSVMYENGSMMMGGEEEIEGTDEEEQEYELEENAAVVGSALEGFPESSE